MQEIQTIEFVDSETQERGVAVIRARNGIIGLALSLEKSADVEVFLATDVCRTLRLAIDKAIETASSD